MTTPAPSAATCATCPWWRNPFKDEQPPSWRDAECRRHAPIAASRKVRRGDLTVKPTWPVTKGDDWCGEHPQRHLAARPEPPDRQPGEVQP